MSRKSYNDRLVEKRLEFKSYLHSLTDHNLELYMEHMELCGNCGDIRHLIGFPIGYPREQIPPLYSYETDLARRIRERWQENPITDTRFPNSITKRYSWRTESNGRLFAVLFAYWYGLPKEQIDQLAVRKRCPFPFQLLRHFIYLSERKDWKQLRKCPYSGECIYSAETYFVFRPSEPDEKTGHLVDGRLRIDETDEVMDVFGL